MAAGMGNEDSNDMEAQFDNWSIELLAKLQAEGSAGPQKLAAKLCPKSFAFHFLVRGEACAAPPYLNMGMDMAGAPVPRSVEPIEDDENDEVGGAPEGDSALTDIEDLAKGMSASKKPKEMLTPMLRASLTKQGYKLIGSHSGVKMCR